MFHICGDSFFGAIGVIVGLYVVLWGKAQNFLVKVEEDSETKRVVNSTEDLNILINESREKIKFCKTDLEEPLLRAWFLSKKK